MPLQRTSSRLDLLKNSMNLDTRATKPSDDEIFEKSSANLPNSTSGFPPGNHNASPSLAPNLGSKKSLSRSNLRGMLANGSSANLRDLVAKESSEPKSLRSLEEKTADSDSGGLLLRRTGSTMSIADLQPHSHPPLPSKAAKNDDSNIMSPPVSPGMPLLPRSHSLTRLETIKPPVSEGQKAVERISGKVDLRLGGEIPHRVACAPQVSKTMATAAPPTSFATYEHQPASKLADQLKKPFAEPEIKPPLQSPIKSPLQPQMQPQMQPQTQPQMPPSAQPSAQPLLRVPPRKLPSLHSPRDDCDAKPFAGERVDYFSHNWNEGDIAGSWRYIISRRQDMANSARLENASWRMWAKAKYGLPTLDPAKINWLKDYDVTWLYGPLYHEFDEDNIPAKSRADPPSQPSEPLSNAFGAGDPATNLVSATNPAHLVSVQRVRDQAKSHTNPSKPPVSHLKSILKKKTLAQMMLEEAHELDVQAHPPSAANHVRSTANYLRHHHYRPMPQGLSRQLVADILNQQYRQHLSPRVSPSSSPPLQPINEHKIASGLSPNTSPTNSPLNSHANSLISMVSRPRSLLSIRSDSGRSYEGRRVRFNDRVDQCIAVDPEAGGLPTPESPKNLAKPQFNRVFESSSSDNDDLDEDDEDEDEDDDEDDEDDDGGGLFLGLRRASVLDQRAEDPKHHIIAALPATTLKYENSEAQDESSDEEYVISDMPVSSSRRPGLNAQYTPHPVQSYEIVDPEIQPVKFEYSEEGKP